MTMYRLLRLNLLAIILMLALGCKEQSKYKNAQRELSKIETPQELVVSSTVGNIDIHYTIQGNKSHALLFIHGWSCDQTYWSEQVANFKENYTVITVDLGGHGKSGTDREDWSIQAFGSDVLDVIQKLDFDELSIIGHSMGVAVAIDVAARIEIPIHSFIGVDYLKNELQPRSEDAVDKSIAPFYTDFETLTKRFVKNMFLPDSDSVLVKKIVNDMASAPPEIAIPAMKGLAMKDMSPDYKKLSNKKMKRYLINSDLSPINDAYLDSLGFKNYVLRDSGHFLMIEKAEEFNALLSKILLK